MHWQYLAHVEPVLPIPRVGLTVPWLPRLSEPVRLRPTAVDFATGAEWIGWLGRSPLPAYVPDMPVDWPVLHPRLWPVSRLMPAEFSFTTRDAFEIVIAVDGTARQANVLPIQGSPWSTLAVAEALNDEPDTATFRVKGFVPREGHAVTIIHGWAKLFGGSVARRTQVNVGSRGNVEYELFCVDWTRLLNRRLVNAKYTSGTVYDNLIDLIANNASGFTTAHVDQTALDAINLDEITFTDEPLANAISRLMKRAGGYWYVDADRDIHAFLEDTGAPPDAITDASLSAVKIEDLVIQTDVSPIRTRVFVIGGGVNALTEIEPGETILPVQAIAWYSTTGGIVKSGPQRITYTGIVEGGTGGLVGPGAAPSAGPALAMAAGAGIESGAHGYAVTFTTAAGESIAGPTISITVGTIPVPTSAPGGTLSSGGNVNAGDHHYEYTFVTATGETTPSPVSSVFTTGGAAASPPTNAPTAGTPTSGGSVTSGAHYYATSFVTASGDTAVGPTSNIITTTAAISNPSTIGSLNVTNPDTNTGLAGDGELRWAFTFKRISDGAETALSPSVGFDANWSAATAWVRVDADASSSPPAGYVRQWYRTVVDGSTFKRVPVDGTSVSGNPTYLQGTEVDIAGTMYLIDHASDASLGASAPGSNGTAIQTVAITGIQTGPGGTTARKLYRTEAGGSTLKLLATISDNSTTTYNDTTADGSLGATAPAGATLNTVNLTGIVVGNAAVTSRKLYRRFNSSGTFKLVTTINDNSTTTFADTIANASLGADAPSSNTATANQVSLTAIPIGGATVTGRKVYRTTAGGATLKLLTTIADNSTTTYADSTADASLGADAPGSDTSGLAQPEGQVAAGSTSLIVANSAGFAAAGGWAVVGNGELAIRYTGKTANTLTGIPASGAGALSVSIAYNQTITQAPALLGVPASGDGSILYTIKQGDPVNIVAQVDDASAQNALATLEGGDGIHEHAISDNRLVLGTATARGQAELDRFKAAIVTATYQTHDPLTRTGKTITFNLGDPTNLVGGFTIQRVVRTEFTGLPGSYPRCSVEASSVKFSIEDLLRRALTDQSG